MTHSAESSQITFSAMRDLFAQKFPDLVKPFDQVKPDLEAGKGAQALANLISCEVEVRDEQGFNTYCWTGRSGPFEMKIPKPFDPAPQQQMQSKESDEGTMKVPVEAAPEQVEENPPAEPESAPPAATITKGLFAALAVLLGESTLLMTVAKTGAECEEPVLTVTVVPQGETECITPMCLTGSATELDAHFVAALESKAESRKRLEQAVADLKAADKELEEAKKKEVEAKRKQTEAKKKATAKLEEPIRVEAAPPESPKPEPQEALF